MNGRDQGGRASNPSRRPRRSSSSNEEGLLALGDLILRQTEPDPSQSANPDLKPEGDGKSEPTDDAVTTRVANEAGLTALGEQMLSQGSKSSGRRRSRNRKKTRHPWRRRFLIGMAVLLVFVGGGAGYVYYQTHDLNRIEVRGLNGALPSGQEAGSENILMVGSTSRCALAHQNAAYGLF